MRRVMAVIGFSSFFVSLFCIWQGKTSALALCIISAVVMIALTAFKKTRIAILILLFATISLSSLNCFITDTKIEKYNEIYCGGETNISGTLLDYPEESESGFNYTFRTDDENKVKFTIMTNEPLDILPGDKISGCFDFSSAYADKTEKIYFSAYTYDAEGIKITKQDTGFSVANLRKTLKQAVNDNTTYGRGLTKAILFGDKSGLTDDLYNDLLRCGMLHAIATSGLHLTIVTGFLFSLTSLLGVSRRKSSAFAIGFVILFMIVIGFKFSLMRAGIMMIMYFAAGLFNREGDNLNSIGLAFAFLIAQNPYTVVSCSFLLSASATIGMIALFSPLYSAFQRINFGRFSLVKRAVASLVASILQSVSAILFTLPVTYIFFGYFSVAGILTNAILSLHISAILIFGVLICLVFYIPVIPEIIGGALDMVCVSVIKTVDFIADFKYCLLSIDYTYMAWFFFACSVVIAAAIIIYYFVKQDKRRVLRVLSLICYDLLLLTVLLINIFPSYDAELKLYNSSSGICITAVTEDKMLVIDTGGKNAVKKASYEIYKKNIDEISLMIVPSNTKNAFASAQSLSKSFKVNNTLCETEMLENSQYNIDSKKTDLSETASVAFGKLHINIIKQENSYVFHLTNGKVSVLIIDSNTKCSQLPRKYRNCDMVVIKDTPPDDIGEVFADSAAICTYEEIAEQKMASMFETYSLRTQTIKVTMDNYLKIKKV